MKKTICYISIINIPDISEQSNRKYIEYSSLEIANLKHCKVDKNFNFKKGNENRLLGYIEFRDDNYNNLKWYKAYDKDDLDNSIRLVYLEYNKNEKYLLEYGKDLFDIFVMTMDELYFIDRINDDTKKIFKDYTILAELDKTKEFLLNLEFRNIGVYYLDSVGEKILIDFNDSDDDSNSNKNESKYVPHYLDLEIEKYENVDKKEEKIKIFKDSLFYKEFYYKIENILEEDIVDFEVRDGGLHLDYIINENNYSRFYDLFERLKVIRLIENI